MGKGELFFSGCAVQNRSGLKKICPAQGVLFFKVDNIKIQTNATLFSFTLLSSFSFFFVSSLVVTFKLSGVVKSKPCVGHFNGAKQHIFH